MNPWTIIVADLRHLRWVAWAVPLLVTVAVAIGVAVSAQERALRTGSPTESEQKAMRERLTLYKQSQPFRMKLSKSE